MCGSPETGAVCYRRKTYSMLAKRGMEMFTGSGAMSLKAFNLRWRHFYAATVLALKCLGKPTSLSISKLLKLEKRASDKGARKEWGRGWRRTRECSEGHCSSNRCLLITS